MNNVPNYPQSIPKALINTLLLQGIKRADVPRRPVFLEIGAHHGTDSIDLLRTQPEAVVHCFEPDPRAWAELNCNVGKFLKESSFNSTGPNRIVHLFNTAVGNADGKTTFFQSGGTPPSRPDVADWDYSSSIHPPTGHLKMSEWCTFDRQIEVAIMKLDTWYHQQKIALEELRGVPATIDFIWMDTQGAEHDVFEGGKEALDNTRYVYTEYYSRPMYEGQKNLDELLAILGPHWELLATYEGYNALIKNKQVR